MAQARRPGAAHALLLLASLCCVSFAHGRIGRAHLNLPPLPSGSVREFQRGGVELDAAFDGIIVSAYTARMRGDVKSFSPSIGETLTRVDGANPDRQSENHSVSVIQGQKWKRTLGKIAEWVFHACVVVLAVYAIFYTISCIFACCIGLDLLAEIWRRLGGWQAFNYFVHVEESIAETDPEPLPLLRSAGET